MLVLFGVLVIIASVILGLIVLVQNPKGGGLSGTIGGFSNQFMGVKQTTDVLEKGTWIFAAIVGVLCIVSPVFIPKNASASSANEKLINETPASSPQPKNVVPVNPATTTPAPATTNSVDTPKKGG